jgi:hypothetical protein
VNKLRSLTESANKAVKLGHFGIFGAEVLALLLNTPVNYSFNKYLHIDMLKDTFLIKA